MYQEAHNCYECLNKVTYIYVSRTYMEMLKRITTYQNKKKMIYENVVFVLFIFVCLHRSNVFIYLSDYTFVVCVFVCIFRLYR